MKLNHTKQKQTKRLHGFTLVEILLVVMIIGILAALVFPKIAGTSEHSRIVAAQTDIHGGIKTAIDHYEIDCGFYPKSLNDLIQQPSDVKGWHGPYLDSPQLPMDPLEPTLRLLFPRQAQPPAALRICCRSSPDGKEGTDDDIGKLVIQASDETYARSRWSN